VVKDKEAEEEEVRDGGDETNLVTYNVGTEHYAMRHM
jgi:hypothetical protein